MKILMKIILYLKVCLEYIIDFHGTCINNHIINFTDTIFMCDKIILLYDEIDKTEDYKLDLSSYDL